MCASVAAQAEPGRASLRVECPALDTEARAVVEARAQAELVSEALPEGEIAVTCDATSATLVWTPKGGAPRERRVELARSGGTIDDTILGALHALVFEEMHPAPPPTLAAPPKVEPPTEPPPAPALAPAPEPAPPHRVRVAGLAGVDAELWQGRVGGALGAYTGLAVSPWERWTFRLAIAPQWALGSADGISAWGLRGVARVDYEVLSRVELGVGVGARSLWANATGTTAPQHDGTTGGAIVAARYVLPLGPVRLSAGPRLEALVRPIVVDYAGKEVFRVPSLVAGIMIEAEAP
jgi:hypothetical protein